MTVRKQKVTMRDVAEHANVSINTVSLTLKGSDMVRPQTRAAVMEAVSHLGYVPNLNAQNLRQGIVRTIGLMIPDTRNPHFWDILDGVEYVASMYGYGVVVANSHLSPQREMESVRGLLARRYDGLILATHFLRDEHIRTLGDIRQHGRPIVTFAETWPSVDRVVYYSQATGHMLLQYLYELGHRRIGFVMGVAREGLADERLRAYSAFMEMHDLPLLIERCGPSIPDSIAASERLLALQDRPTAIVAVNDYLALGVMRAAAQCGLNIPTDLSVAGFDNTSFAGYLVPALTSLDVGGTTIGEAAARLLFERLSDPDRPQQIVEISARLVIRESTSHPRR